MGQGIFLSYSHQDREWLDRLKVCLKPYLRHRDVYAWDDTQIRAGADWRQDIEKQLRVAQAAILLVSQDFLASDFIYKNELQPLLRAAKQRGLRILWIPLSASGYKTTGLQEFQALTDPENPLDSFEKPALNKALVAICEKITEGWEEEVEPTGDKAPDAKLTSGRAEPGAVPALPDGAKVVILYKHTSPDENVMHLLRNQLEAAGHQVFVDRRIGIGLKWAETIERQLREADAVIALLSATSVYSEMLAYELQVAHEAQQEQKGRPRILPVRVQYEEPLPDPLAGILFPLQYALWSGPGDNQHVVASVLNSLRSPRTRVPTALPPPGGAMPLYTDFYLPRDTDREFHSAILRQDGVVLIKGPRQMGKTSLLARGLQAAREAGARVVMTDVQKLGEEQIRSLDGLLLTLAQWMADQLELDLDPAKEWSAVRGAGRNFERFLSKALGRIQSPFVWGLDEVDRLFPYEHTSEFFGLLRAWYNERSTLPDAPWHNLTVAIAFATEAHLFIRNLNQSPFNVGTPLTLKDFTREQVARLNEKYGSPLGTPAELEAFCRLVGGHPYLTSRGLHHLRSQPEKAAAFAAQADQEDGPYGDHLRRILVVLARDEALRAYLRNLLVGEVKTPDERSFYRLKAAGLIRGPDEAHAEPRCELYERYLKRHLVESPQPTANGR